MDNADGFRTGYFWCGKQPRYQPSHHWLNKFFHKKNPKPLIENSDPKHVEIFSSTIKNNDNGAALKRSSVENK